MTISDRKDNEGHRITKLSMTERQIKKDIKRHKREYDAKNTQKAKERL
jgi:hypothetical protein